jgi:hypothetical protein
VRLLKENWVLLALSEGQALLPQFMCLPELRAVEIKPAQAR